MAIEEHKRLGVGDATVAADVDGEVTFRQTYACGWETRIAPWGPDAKGTFGVPDVVGGGAELPSGENVV